MPQSKTITTYSFAELLELSKQDKSFALAAEKARVALQGLEVDDDWYKYELEDFAENFASPLGFEITDPRKMIFFSGFGSQGDGASFECDVNLDTFLTAYPAYKTSKTFGKLFAWMTKHDYQASIAIKRTHSHYHHSGTMTIDSDYTSRLIDLPANLQPLADALDDRILNHAKSLANDLYKNLEAQYNYLSSDECLIEMSDANKLAFDAQGHMV